MKNHPFIWPPAKKGIPLPELFAIHARELGRRLVKKVAIGEADTCWEWKRRSRHWFGYGVLHLSDPTTGKRHGLLAHRVAYALAHGEWPPRDLVVRHSCDNPACCNPAHLKLGTQGENIADKVARGRTRMNLRNRPNSRLNEEQAIEIKQALAEGGWGIQRRLAEKYGVTEAHITAIRRGLSWAHVGPAVAPPKPQLRPETVAAIKANLARGDLGKAIAERHGVCANTVSKIKRGEIWTDIPAAPPEKEHAA